MWSKRTVVCGGIAAASIGLIALAPAGFAGSATSSGSLTVVTASQHVAMAEQAVRVPVVVRSPDAGLLCKPVHVAVTYWSGHGARHQVSVDRAAGAVEATTLMIPARHVRTGMLRYTVIATQGCGLFDASSHYYGRAPSTGSYAVRVIAAGH